MKKTIEEALKYNSKALELVWKQLLGTNFPADQRSTLVLAYVAVATEHQKAISTLVNASLKGSALAMMRLQLETFMRGMWAHLLASDDQVKAISQKGAEPFPRPFKDMVQQIDTAYGAGGWLNLLADQWGTLNGYTHSGLEQLGMRFRKDGNIEPSYPDQVIADLLTLSGTVTVGVIAPLLRGFGFADKAEALEQWLSEDAMSAMKEFKVYPILRKLSGNATECVKIVIRANDDSEFGIETRSTRYEGSVMNARVAPTFQRIPATTKEEATAIADAELKQYVNNGFEEVPNGQGCP